VKKSEQTIEGSSHRKRRIKVNHHRNLPITYILTYNDTDKTTNNTSRTTTTHDWGGRTNLTIEVLLQGVRGTLRPRFVSKKMEGVFCYGMLGCSVVLCHGVGSVLHTTRHTYIQSLYTAHIMISHEY
jgi:hypothetical protein